MKRSLALGAVLLQSLASPGAWADPSGVPRFMREQASLLNGGKPVLPPSWRGGGVKRQPNEPPHRPDNQLVK